MSNEGCNINQGGRGRVIEWAETMIDFITKIVHLPE